MVLRIRLIWGCGVAGERAVPEWRISFRVSLLMLGVEFGGRGP